MSEQIEDPRGGNTTRYSKRPWGEIHMVVRNQKCSVDLTHVMPGERSSLHAHTIRHELFHFLDDGAYLELEGEIARPKAHEEYLIKPGHRHRFWAEENEFRMLVVSFGKWTSSDQTRYEDDYGREGTELEI